MTPEDEQAGPEVVAPPTRPVASAPAGGRNATMIIIGALFAGAVVVYLLLFVLGIGR